MFGRLQINIFDLQTWVEVGLALPYVVDLLWFDELLFRQVQLFNHLLKLNFLIGQVLLAWLASAQAADKPLFLWLVSTLEVVIAWFRNSAWHQGNGSLLFGHRLLSLVEDSASPIQWTEESLKLWRMGHYILFEVRIRFLELNLMLDSLQGFLRIEGWYLNLSPPWNLF